MMNTTQASEDDNFRHTMNCTQYQQRIRSVLVHASQAKGVPDSRSKLSAMIQWDYQHRDNQTALDFHPVHIHDFYFQIDSHSDFADDYDVSLIEMFHRTRNDYAVLSTYPNQMDQRSNEYLNTVPNLCIVHFPDPYSVRMCIHKNVKVLLYRN
jgi:hypothetical protein